MESGPVFFLSYAQDDRDAHPQIREFFDDVSRWLRPRLTGHDGPVGFLDSGSITPGADWRDALAEALRTAEVFVPLVSPAYFASSMCGKEWYAFKERLSGVEQELEKPGRILPVLFVPSRDLRTMPPVCEGIQWNHDDYPREYARGGLSYLLGMPKARAARDDFIHELVDKLLQARENGQLLPAVRRPVLETTPNAFHDVPPTSAGPHTSTPPTSPTTVGPDMSATRTPPIPPTRTPPIPRTPPMPPTRTPPTDVSIGPANVGRRRPAIPWRWVGGGVGALALALVVVLVVSRVGGGADGTQHAAAAGPAPAAGVLSPATPTLPQSSRPPPDTPVAAPSTPQIFPLPRGAAPVDIAATPNGGAWFTEPGTNSIGHISAEGALDHYTAHGSVVHPFAIVAGPTGDAWFTEGVPVGDRGRGGDRIGHIDVTGAITFYRIPSPDAGAVGIALGPEHTVWFTEQRLGQIGRLDPDGSVVEFPAGAAQPDQITLGPDDNLWFTAFGAHRISRMTKDGRLIQTYDVAAGGTDPVDITSQDGQLWFTVIDGHRIGQLDPSTGTVGWIDVPGVGTRGPANLTADPARGGIWFTDLDSATVAYLSAPNAGAPQIYPRVQLAVDSSPIGIAAANAGVVWFAEQSGNAIGRLTG